MKTSGKEYFIEVYGNEFGNSENQAEFIGQEEYPSLLAAYDAAKDIPEMYSGLNFDHLEIVDSEDLNRVYYTLNIFGGKIHEPELHELLNNRENAKVKKTGTTRKEISKDDYKFFIGRVEKISNGQVAFIADTQKKAVALLGEKIPQNVIDAENNYKAFNIWLGNMVNPIIVSDSGYKEEIRVFGDGYDFFEVKAETKPDKNNPKTGGNAAAVIVDLSNATGVKTAENQICAALQNNSLSDGDYALLKIAHKMIAALAEEDELAKKCAAIDSVCTEVYAVEAYTSANFMTITLKDMRELGDAKDLMILAKVNENDYRTSWGKGLIRGFSFNRNAVAKAVIYTLNLAGIKADGRTDYTMVDEVSTENGATNVEIENAVKRENDMPSVEKFFAAVTTEIKPHIRGKYFVQIDDNWYQQSVRENFKTLEDAVKVARIMHSELCKVSRHIYATVDARTIDISKYCFRADDWTTFFEIDNYGNEKVLRRETVDAIAKIDNRTVEEVRNDIGRSTDNYGIYKNSAVTVENAPAEIDSNAEIIACIDDYAVDVDAAAEVEIENAKNAAAAEIYAIKVKTAEDATKLIQMTMSNGLICQNIERGKVLTHNGKNLLLEIDGETKISNWEYSMYAEEIHRKLDLLPVIKSEVDDYDSINGELNSILVKVNGLDVIYYGYGFGPDFHEYDEKLLHINVDRDKHSLTDSKYDEFKTYKSKKKMNTALARYGLNFEQVEQFFANEQSKMDCENEKIHAFIADALNMGDAERGKKIKLIPQKDLGKSYVMLTARDVASRDFDYRKMCDGEYHIRTCRKWSFTLSSVAVYETEQQAHEVVKMLGVAIQRGEEYFTFPEVEEVTTPAEEKNPLKAKILAAELAAENAHKERENFFKNLYLKMCGDYYIATGFVQYVTDYAKVVYRKDGDKYIEDAAAFAELKSMENKMKELYHKAHELNNIALKADILKAKIAEQKNFRKSVIDWKATFDDMKISEILNLQKDLKKFLKLGQIDLAENIFAMLKTLCKNYRAHFAA